MAFNWGGAGQGASSGASTGSMLGPWGAAIGGIGGGLLGGFTGGSASDPYKKGMEEYEKWIGQARDVQNPFLQFGQNAMPGYEQWLGGMKDPSSFIKNLMGQYQQSPFAQFQQEQAMRAAQNMGSASGLTGSTPLTQFAQQNARDISSQDMNQWLQNVLGINEQYGKGLFGQMGMGQHAADMLSNMYGQAGQDMASGAFGENAGHMADRNRMLYGLFNAGKSFFGSDWGN